MSDKTQCCLCGDNQTGKYCSLFETKSKTTNSPLVDLISHTSKLQSNSLVCEICCGLINEIDEMTYKINEIKNKFETYLQSVELPDKVKKEDMGDKHSAAKTDNVDPLSDKTHCCLCGQDLKENCSLLFETKTKTTNLPLIDLVLNCSKYLQHSSSLVCELCCGLVNEIDDLSMKVKEIQKKFEAYYVPVEVKNEILESDEYEGKIDDDIKLEIPAQAFCQVELGGEVRANSLEIDDKSCGSSEKDDYGKSSESSESSSKGKRKRGESTKKKEVKYDCYCSESFTKKKDYFAHLKTHGTHPFVCHICGQSFKQKSNYTIHMDIHNGKSPVKCDICNKSFTQKQALLFHLPIHTGEKKYQCDKCGKRFAYRGSFNIHKQLHAGIGTKCTVCGLIVQSGPSHFESHMRTHTKEKPFECTTCGKSFALKWNLIVHERIHNPELQEQFRFKCEICGKSYQRQNILQRHIIKKH